MPFFVNIIIIRNKRILYRHWWAAKQNKTPLPFQKSVSLDPYYAK